MAAKFKVDFSINNLSLKQQDKIFRTIIHCLNYTQRQDLHITVTDPIGGEHKVWENTGLDANGIPCKICKLVDCRECPIYQGREKNGE